MKLDLNPIIKALKTILPVSDSIIGLHEPYFIGNERIYLQECLDTRWVSSVGKFVDRLEIELANYTGVKRAIAVVNGTAALYICLQLVGVSRGDEVLIPTMTFVATANAVAYCGAIPHFIDSEEKTLGVDPHKLAIYLEQVAEIKATGCYNLHTGRLIRALVPVHTFGHPVDLEPLLQVCEEFKLTLVEDAAESLGSFYRGKHTGNWGRVSALSFNGNKIITTGGGGAILTQDEELANLAKHITTTAKLPHRWQFNHDQIGYNYRMPNLNAALGVAQLETLPQFVQQKRRLAAKYIQVFQDIQGVKIFLEPEFAKSNYWLNVLLLDEEFAEQRDELLELTNAQGIMTRPAWTLMHQLPMYQDCPRMNLDCAESLARRLLNLPSSAFLS